MFGVDLNTNTSLIYVLCKTNDVFHFVSALLVINFSTFRYETHILFCNSRDNFKLKIVSNLVDRGPSKRCTLFLKDNAETK